MSKALEKALADGGIVLVDNDDWMGIYKNGKLVDQNHSFSLAEGLSILKIPFTAIEPTKEHDGYLPKNLKDV